MPPKAGDAWRFNVFRIKRPGGPKAPGEGAVFAAWSVPDGQSFHVPAKFRPVQVRVETLARGHAGPFETVTRD